MDRRDNFYSYDAKSKENADDDKNKYHGASIFGKIKNKISNLFFINNEDGQEEKPQVIQPSYINENEHIYDAPSLYYFNNQNNETEKNEKNLNQYQSSLNTNEYQASRRFSLDSSKTRKTKKKVNPIIKIATYITNKKFGDKKKADDASSTNSNIKSAFKLIDQPYKNINLESKKIINYNDFYEVLKDKNIIKPVALRRDEEEKGYRAISRKRERECQECESLSQNNKKRRMTHDGQSIFSSVTNINRLKQSHKEDVSMHSINSVLASQHRNVESQNNIPNQNNIVEDVSMHFRRTENKSNLTGSQKSKTLDEIRREIELKRGVNRKMIDEISKRSSRRTESIAFDYEEKKKVLNNYYKEKGKVVKDVEISPGFKSNFPSSIYDTTRDRNYSLTKSSITIPSTVQKKEPSVTVEKKEQLEICPTPVSNAKTEIVFPISETNLTKRPEPNYSNNKETPTSYEQKSTEVKVPAEVKSTIITDAKKTEPQEDINKIESSMKDKPTEKKGENNENKIFGSFGTNSVPMSTKLFGGMTSTNMPSTDIKSNSTSQSISQPILFADKKVFEKPKEELEPNPQFAPIVGSVPSISTNIASISQTDTTSTPTFGKTENKQNMFDLISNKTEQPVQIPTTTNNTFLQKKEDENSEIKKPGLFNTSIVTMENNKLPATALNLISPFMKEENGVNKSKQDAEKPQENKLFSGLSGGIFGTKKEPEPEKKEVKATDISSKGPLFKQEDLLNKKEGLFPTKKETPITSSTFTQQTFPDSSSTTSLYNSSNPFLVASMNPNPMSKNAFTSPDNKDSEKVLPSQLINNPFIIKSNDFNKKETVNRFGTAFPQTTSQVIPDDNGMAISPITSPKTISKTEEVPSGNLFRLSNTGSMFRPSSSQNNLQTGAFGGMGMGIGISSALSSSSSQVPSLGLGQIFSANQQQMQQGTATNPFTPTGSITFPPGGILFNQPINLSNNLSNPIAPTTGGLFGNNSSTNQPSGSGTANVL